MDIQLQTIALCKCRYVSYQLPADLLNFSDQEVGAMLESLDPGVIALIHNGIWRRSLDHDNFVKGNVIRIAYLGTALRKISNQ